MSAVKSFALGLSMMVLGVQSAPAGSMHSHAAAHPKNTQKTTAHDAPTTLAFAAPPAAQPFVAPQLPTINVHHSASAENLAGPSYNIAPAYSPPYTPPQAASATLTLGLNGGSVTSLGTIQNGPPASYIAPASTTPATATAPAPAQVHADALINFGTGPYPEAGNLTTGNAVGFFNSPVFTHLFGPGGPTMNDVGNFENEVLATIKATYNNAGLPINLTTDPNTPAAHTMSVVSGASYPGSPGTIGITDVGNNGFSFIDKFAGVRTVDQLAIAIGHNLSHELMHAFGIANHPEQTGPYVDAASSTLATLSDPSTGFSQAAAGLLSTLNFQAVGQSVTAGAQKIDGDQMLIGAASTVPEPSAVALWTLAGGLLAASRRRKPGRPDHALRPASGSR